MYVIEHFMMGGIWMYLLTALWIAVAVLLVHQFQNLGTKNYLAVLWASLPALLCLGFLGTTVGITRMGLAIGGGTADLAPVGGVAYPADAALAKGLGIAMIPGSYALMVVFVLMIGIGVAHSRMHSRRPG